MSQSSPMIRYKTRSHIATDYITESSKSQENSECKVKFEKFITLPNEFVHPTFQSSHRQRYHDLLLCSSLEEKICVNEFSIHESFISHYWNLIQMAEAYSSIPTFSLDCVDNSDHPISFPLRIYLNYVLDEESIAQILSYEIWIDEGQFCHCMQEHGTFPFEVTFTHLLRRMLSKCNGVEQFRTIGKISDSQYKFLLDVAPKIPFWKPELPLYKHQLETFYWMSQLEKDITNHHAFLNLNQFCTPILSTNCYYNRQYEIITKSKTDKQLKYNIKGGIVADITGSGKTAVALALVLSTLNRCESMDSLMNAKSEQNKSVFSHKKKQIENSGGSFNKDSSKDRMDMHDALMTVTEDQLLFRSIATLIITPNNLIHQWILELEKFVHTKHLKIIVIQDYRDFKKITLSQLLEADFVFTTDTFLQSKRYNDEVLKQVKLLVKFPFVDYDLGHSIQQMAWRIAVNKHKSGFEEDHCIPLESIKWKRIIIDEIHILFGESRANKWKETWSRLNACVQWGLSGTPMIQNGNVMQHYVQFVCGTVPIYWSPEFTQSLVNKCFHRFEGLELYGLQKHLHLLEHSAREKQLLHCCQDDLKPEKIVQLCSYFNLVDVDDMNQKIQLLTIDDIIRCVKKQRKNKIRDIETKIKHHDHAIRNITSKIEDTKQQIKQWVALEKQRDEHKETEEPSQLADQLVEYLTDHPPDHASNHHHPSNMSPSIQPSNISNLPHNFSVSTMSFSTLSISSFQPFLHSHDTDTNSGYERKEDFKYVQEDADDTDMTEIKIYDLHQPESWRNVYKEDIRDAKDMIIARKKRLERITQRKDQLSREKKVLEKSMGFFESKVSDVNIKALEQCPICMNQVANVITQCGHLFCRTCIVKCLKRKYQCPICKTEISPKDAHEIKIDSEENKTHPVSEHIDDDHHITKYGTKLTKLLQLLTKIQEAKEKVVIYVQWPALMCSIREVLQENNIYPGVLFGNTTCQNAALKKFKTCEECFVLLGSVDHAGLDFSHANHLIFIHALVGDDYVVRANEEQAIARIHRQGQKKVSHIHWFIIRGTVEEKIYLQTRL